MQPRLTLSLKKNTMKRNPTNYIQSSINGRCLNVRINSIEAKLVPQRTKSNPTASKCLHVFTQKA